MSGQGVPRFMKRPSSLRRAEERPQDGPAGRSGDAPTITAHLDGGPLEGSSVEAEVVEGRPPKTIDVAAADGTTCRYCLAQWEQAGGSAAYTFLYTV